MLHVPCALLPFACFQRQRACCTLHALGGTSWRLWHHAACRACWKFPTLSSTCMRAQCPLRRCALHVARRRTARVAAHTPRCVAWLRALRRMVACDAPHGCVAAHTRASGDATMRASAVLCTVCSCIREPPPPGRAHTHTRAQRPVAVSIASFVAQHFSPRNTRHAPRNRQHAA
jgi:hypothetical protein